MAKSDSHESQDLWDNYAKEGETFKALETELVKSIESLKTRDPKTVFVKGTTQFTPSFQEKLEANLTEIFEKYPNLDRKILQKKREEVIEQLVHELDLTINKEILCELEFDSYAIYQFISAFSNDYTETTFHIEEEQISIREMDPSRITLLQLLIADNSYKCYTSGDVAFNLEDLEDLLKVNKADNSTTHIIIGKEALFLTITSDKYHSIIERRLKAIELDREPVPPDNLLKIQHPFHFAVSRDQFEYIIRNLNKTSEVANLLCLEDRVQFSEGAFPGDDYESLTQKANHDNAITFKKAQLSSIECDKEFVEGDSPPFAFSAYSTQFLKILKNLVSTLNNSDSLNFSAKIDHPLRIDVAFHKLGNTTLTYFMAPRVPEVILP